MFLAALLFMPALSLYSRRIAAEPRCCNHATIDSRTPGRSRQRIKWSGNLNAILMHRLGCVYSYEQPYSTLSPSPMPYYVEAQFHRIIWNTLLERLPLPRTPLAANVFRTSVL